MKRKQRERKKETKYEKIPKQKRRKKKVYLFKRKRISLCVAQGDPKIGYHTSKERGRHKCQLVNFSGQLEFCECFSYLRDVFSKSR